MNLVSPMISLLPRPAYRTAYRAQQASIRYPVMAVHLFLAAFASQRQLPDAKAVRSLRRRYEDLLARDLRNVDRGLYPRKLLFQLPLRDYAKTLPGFLLDIPRVIWRSRRRDHRDVPQDIDARRFPAYFRQTFHWQTDGYLSRRSARLYDLSVEFMFMGCADVMRRQVIPPISRFARRNRSHPLRILDVGCGTGRALCQIASALPGHRYFGVDLSPYYLESARQQLAEVPEVTLVAENAEQLPFRDDYFDAVASVFLFHELPRKARRQVMAEIARVLRPGGLLVIEDSAQLVESSDLAVFLESFATQMHEPYYRDYVRDDLEQLIGEAGFEVGDTQRIWLSKVVCGTKPSAA
ncbi:MAG: methyltransferase domain-containing protein [Myxococcota bacterium]